MTESSRCHVCGTALLDDGLPCPKCVFEAALKSIPAPSLVHQSSLQSLEPNVNEVRRFGDYELQRLLGEGGMGQVFQARQLRLNRQVALKLIHCKRKDAPAFKSRFLREAQLAAGLQHPNIVPIFEVGEHEGDSYYSMELVVGKNLEELVGHTPLAPNVAARYVQAVAEAVEYAHKQGVVHRDLKPTNIMVGTDDRPRVTDFGLARRLDNEWEQSLEGQAVGSPGFMPPEQVTGKRAEMGPASDIYGLGAVLYYLLIARPPFAAETAHETMRQACETDPIAPRELNPAVPKDLDTICLKCLEKSPQRRYRSTAALAQDLERWRKNEPIEARPISRSERTMKWARRNPTVAGLLGVCLTILIAGFITTTWQWRLAQRANRQIRETLAQARSQKASEDMAQGRIAESLMTAGRLLRDNPGDRLASSALLMELTYRNFAHPVAGPFGHTQEVNSVGFSRDSKYLVTASADGVDRVWDLASIGTSPLLQVPHGETLAMLSPNNRWIATCERMDGLHIWGFPGGRLLQALTNTGPIASIAFSDDSRLLAYGTKTGSVGVLGTEPLKQLWSAAAHDQPVHTVQFSANGARLLSSATNAIVWDAVTGKNLSQPLENTKPVTLASFEPDGESVVTASDDEVQRWNERAGIWSGAVLKLKGKQVLSLSPNGKLIVVSAAPGSLQVMDAITGSPVSSSVNVKSVFKVSFSSDGRWFLTCSDDHITSVWNAATGVPLCENINQEIFFFDAVFSSDGKWIATTDAEGSAIVWDPNRGISTPTTFASSSPITKADFDSTGTRVVTGDNIGAVRLWDAWSGAEVWSRMTHTGKVNVVRYSPNGHLLLTASEDQTARLLNADDGLPLTCFSHRAPVLDAAFDDAGRRLVTACKDGLAWIWDVASGKPICPPLKHDPLSILEVNVMSATFTQDGNAVITGCYDGGVRLWNAKNGALLGLLADHGGPAVQCEVGAKSPFCVCASWDNSVSVARIPLNREDRPDLTTETTEWDELYVSEKQKIRGVKTRFLRHRDAVSRVHFSHDGTLLASSSKDGTARIWTASNGAALGPPMVHPYLVFDTQFSPDDRRIATVSRDGTARIWDVRTGLPLGGALRHPGEVIGARFSPDGQRLLTWSKDGKARIWESPCPQGPAPNWLPVLAEAIGGRRLQDSGAIETVSVHEFIQLREALYNLPATNSWTAWAGWFFGQRTNSLNRPALSPDRARSHAHDAGK